MARTLYSAALLIAVASSLSGCAEAYVVQNVKDPNTRIVAVPMDGLFPMDPRAAALDFIHETDPAFKVSDIVREGPTAGDQQKLSDPMGKANGGMTAMAGNAPASSVKEYRIEYKIKSRMPGSALMSANGAPDALRNPNGSPKVSSGITQTGTVGAPVGNLNSGMNSSGYPQPGDSGGYPRPGAYSNSNQQPGVNSSSYQQPPVTNQPPATYQNFGNPR